MNDFLILFLNWLIIHAAGLVSAVMIFDAICPRKHSMTVWNLYYIPRAVIRSLASAATACGMMTPALLTADVIFIIITGVINFVVLWYTWDAEPLKICITGVISDLISGISMVIGVSLVNMMCGNGLISELVTLTPVYVLVADAFLLLIVRAIIYILRPAFRWFSGTDLQHRNILRAVVVIMIAAFCATNLTDNQGFNASIIIVSLVAALILIPFGAYILKNMDIRQNRKVLLRQRSEMTSAYIMAVDSQSSSLAEHSRILDDVRAGIEASGKSLEREDLRKYVDELREYADSLRNGKFSSNLALDAVLSSFAARFEQMGYETDISADVSKEDDVSAADISWVILNWAAGAVQPCEDAKSVALSHSAVQSAVKSHTDTGSAAPSGGYAQSAVTACDNSDKNASALRSDARSRGRLVFSVRHMLNQIIFSMSVTGTGKTKFPRRILDTYIGKDGTITDGCRGDTLELGVMKEVE